MSIEQNRYQQEVWNQQAEYSHRVSRIRIGIGLMVEKLFQSTNTLVDGTTWMRIEGNSALEKLELLKQLAKHPAMQDHDLLTEINQVIEEAELYPRSHFE